jgi:hypothetical protein
MQKVFGHHSIILVKYEMDQHKWGEKECHICDNIFELFVWLPLANTNDSLKLV